MLFDDAIKIYWRGTEAEFGGNLSNSLYFLKRISESFEQNFQFFFQIRKGNILEN